MKKAMRFTFGYAQHIGARKQQQDRFGNARSQDGFTALVVADGMGGMAHGEKASQSAIDAFLASWQASRGKDLSELLKQCIEAANADVFRAAMELKASMEMGTTMIAAAFGEEGMSWASVGDSAIYLIRDGRLRQLNVFHNYGRELDRLAAQGMIPPEIVATHPEREALTSFVGLETIRMMDRSAEPVPLEPGDWVLLATDGLFKTVEHSGIVDAARGAAQRACDEMVRRVLAVNDPHQDNVTVLAVRAEQPRRRIPIPALVTAVGAASAAAAWVLRKQKK